jgi:mono/diheme cytochrome c family protein
VEHAEAEKSGPALRLLGPGDRETRISIESDGKPHDYVFEMIAGNGRVRTTLGETSLSLHQTDGMHTLLTPSAKVVPLTDEGWADFRKERLAFYAVHDQKRRQSLRAKQDVYWAQRHEQAREVIAAKKPLKQAGIDTLLAASWAKASTAGKQAAGGIDFAKQIKPILAENCFRCHEEKAKGGLRLNTLEAAQQGGESGKPAIVPGKPAESQLISMVHPDAGDEIMPPKGDPLSDTQRKLLADWITQGASFASASQKIEPTALTEDLEFLRRVTLDTVGVVPSATEINAFLAEDSPQRRERAVDRLLKDTRWADHWTAYWQDVLAENPNILKPSLNNSGPFRFWIHEALSDNLPMDRFVTELGRSGGFLIGSGKRCADGREGAHPQHCLPWPGDDLRTLPRLAVSSVEAA